MKKAFVEQLLRLASAMNLRRAAIVKMRLSEIYSTRPAKLDPVFENAQMKSLEQEVW